MCNSVTTVKLVYGDDNPVFIVGIGHCVNPDTAVNPVICCGSHIFRIISPIDRHWDGRALRLCDSDTLWCRAASAVQALTL